MLFDLRTLIIRIVVVRMTLLRLILSYSWFDVCTFHEKLLADWCYKEIFIFFICDCWQHLVLICPRLPLFKSAKWLLALKRGVLGVRSFMTCRLQPKCLVRIWTMPASCCWCVAIILKNLCIRSIHNFSFKIFTWSWKFWCLNTVSLVFLAGLRF